MDTTMLLYVAVFVFVMMIIGLILTVREFRYGEPARQDIEPESVTEPPEERTRKQRKAA